MRFVHESFPRELSEFRKLLVRHQDEGIDLMTDLIRESLELIEMKRENPARFGEVMKQKDLERQAYEQAQTARDATGKEREQEMAKLRKTLDETFDIKHTLMKEDVALMEEELGNLKDLIGRREQNRAAIIARRVSELTGEEDDLEW